MVGAAFAQPADRGGRWVVYLALSLCANAIFLTFFAPALLTQPVIDMPVLKVNLMTIARPAPVAPPPVAISDPPPDSSPMPEPVVTEPVVTTAFAPAKIAVLSKKAQPEPRPVVVAKAAPVPLPRVRPKTLPVDLSKIEPVKEPVTSAVAATLERPDDVVTDDKSEPEQKPAVAAEPVISANKGQDESTVVHEARYLRQVPPAYPRRALDLGQQGTVTLHAEVLPSGDPRELKIAKSSGHRLLDMAALAAVRKWKFEPTSVDGAAIVSWVRVPVNFVIR